MIIPAFAYVLVLLAGFLNLFHPEGEYNVYCAADNSMCVLESDTAAIDGYTIQKAYPIECVNGEWMQVNRTGAPSGREDVFDVGPWNPPTTTFDGCEPYRSPWSRR